MNKYTVCGYYENNCQLFTAHVEAKNETEAVFKTPETLKADPDNVMIVSVFEGTLKELNECPTVSCAQDWPNPNGD
jgi:hypothetical protein